MPLWYLYSIEYILNPTCFYLSILHYFLQIALISLFLHRISIEFTAFFSLLDFSLPLPSWFIPLDFYSTSPISKFLALQNYSDPSAALFLHDAFSSSPFFVPLIFRFIFICSSFVFLLFGATSMIVGFIVISFGVVPFSFNILAFLFILSKFCPCSHLNSNSESYFCRRLLGFALNWSCSMFFWSYEEQ